MELNFLKKQNGIKEWEDLGENLYRGRTSKGKEVVVKAEREDGWEDDDCTAIIFDGQPGDACEMCGVLHTAHELINNGGELLCNACAAEIRKK